MSRGIPESARLCSAAMCRALQHLYNDTNIGDVLPQREWPHMPRDGAIIFSDLIGKLDVSARDL